MNRYIRKQFHVQPTFDDIEQEIYEEEWKDPGPGLARQATEFVLSQFYTRNYDQVMQEPSAQEQALAGVLKPFRWESHSQEFPARQAQQGQWVQQARKGRLGQLEVKDRLEQLEVKDRQEDKALQGAMGGDASAKNTRASCEQTRGR